MKIAVLGTGMVGNAIATKLCALGHEVMMGSRTRDNEKALAWVEATGKGASAGTFAEAAAFGEMAFNCTLGAAALEALGSTGSALDGKVLIDTSNPLDFSKGMPPSLFSGNSDSLGEQIQRALPKAKVVKTLNTVNCNIMVDAGRVKGDHDIFVSGNDAEAKSRVKEILQSWFGWKSVIDLGDIATCRGTESYLPLWIRLWGALGTADFNIKIVR